VAGPGRHAFDDTVSRLIAGTHSVIDLDRYVSNIRTLRSLAPPGAAFMAVVKADAYGHGMVQCALAAEPDIDWFGVARIQEALRLRQEGVTAPILVLGPPNVAEINTAIRYDITLTIGAEDHLDRAEDAVSATGLKARVHLKVDTGMHRYGFFPGDESLAAAERLSRNSAIELNGIYTHFSSSDETDAAPTDAQLGTFNATVGALHECGIDPRYIHAANSAAIIADRAGATNLVRAGIATYGLSPSDEVPVTQQFQPILSVKAVVTRRFSLAPGDGVSYGLTYRATNPEAVAATGIGYADGLPRQLSNRGWFLTADHAAPIRGRVCMDQTVISVSEQVAVGDSVLVIGDGTSGEMTLDDVARIAGTNNYEVATRVMARVPRVYVRGGEPVAYEHLLLGESRRIGVVAQESRSS
jgi:alanine racemase